MNLIRHVVALAAVSVLSACGPTSDDGVGGVSASEASALNDAAAMLDARAGAGRAEEAVLNPAAITAARADRGRVAPRPEKSHTP